MRLCLAYQLVMWIIHFNPRTRMGCDIRAGSNPDPRRGFQSTHPHGVRHAMQLVCFSIRLFQSTHPHGVRLSRSVCPLFWRLFQSTHPHGVRRCGQQKSSRPPSFQSTHPHGVRPYRFEHSVDNAQFQSTHPHGVRRQRKTRNCIAIKISIHAPAWGATFSVK